MQHLSLSPLKQQKLLTLIQSFSDEEAAFVLKHLKYHRRLRVKRIHIFDLAKETMTYIFSFVHDAKTLSHCSRVCKVWQSILMDNFMWKQICKKKEYLPIKVSFNLPRSLSLAPWKHVFFSNYLTSRNWKIGKYKVQRLNKQRNGLCMEFNDTLAYTVSRGQPGTLWEIPTGNCKTLLDHEGIASIKLNDSFVVTGSREGVIRLYNLKLSKWVLQIQAHANSEIGALSLQGDRIISGSEDHSIKVWSFTGECLHELNGHEAAICSIEVHDDLVVSGSADADIKLWSLRTNQCLLTLRKHVGPVFCVRFNSKYICSGGNDGKAIVWELNTGKLVRLLSGHTDAVVSLQFDDSKVVTGSADNTIKVRRRGNTVRVTPGQFKDQAVRKDSTTDQIDLDVESASAIFKKFIRLFLASSLTERKEYLIKILKQCDPYDMKFLNEQIPRLHRDFLSIPEKKIVNRILEYLHPKDLVTISLVSQTWFQLMTNQKTWFSLYESIGLESMASVFYINNGTPLQNAKRYHSYGNWAHGHFCYREFQAHTLGILCMAFDGKFIATGSTDRTCKIFHVRTGNCIRMFTGHEEAVQAVQFDEEKVISGSADKTIKVWSNKDSGSLIQTLTHHTAAITCLSLAGMTLVSGSEDKTLRIWNLQEFFAKAKHIDQLAMPTNNRRRAQVIPKTYTNPCLRILHGHDSALKSIELHKDLIFSGDIHGYIRIWHLPSGNCLGVLGVSPISQTIIRLGNPDNSKPIPLQNQILHEPIVAIQYQEQRMLIATLSGCTFLLNVNPMPVQGDTSLHKGYVSHLQWINNETNMTTNQFFRFEDTNTLGAKREVGMQGQWVLFSRTDDWRLMSGGSQGYVVVWNHRIGKYLYKLRVASDTGENEKKSDSLTSMGVRSNGSLFSLNTRMGSLASFAKKDKSSTDTRALTGLAFDDSFIIAAGMNGNIFVWEPNM